MSVIASEGLAGKAVRLSEVPDAPVMIATAIDTETKQVTVSWVDKNHAAQQATFPSKALEKVEAAEQKKAAPAAKKPPIKGGKK